MTIKTATDLIKSCAAQMDARYQKTVFDEWAVVSLTDNKGHLLAYVGPRKQGFQQNFLADARSLWSALTTEDHAAGDFEFARHSVGTGFEAFMAIGKDVYLICNNTVQSMDTIAKDPLWLSAQVPFVELSDQFRADPVVALIPAGEMAPA